ncbi:hypothetical protein [uncultured Paracoccus sp.]|uniref:DUF6927 domain-containing protein n=1 Tax=uncultured Paracoccus sp. TaxID=189685 RepID=UPI0026100BF5|nr:hypothetical protein [uncultured Paracoccus sp.]
MGWLVYNHTPSCIRDEIARLCGGEDDDRRSYPVLISHKGSVWYAAVRSEPKPAGRREDGLCPYGDYVTDATGGYVFAAIFLTTTQGGGWGYKSMTETAGPTDAAAHAPEKLLSLLSETVNDHASDWRQRCRSHAAKERRPLKPGDVIRLAEPLRFTDGAELQTFRVARIRYGRLNRTVFISTDNGGHYRISNIRTRDWTRI